MVDYKKISKIENEAIWELEEQSGVDLNNLTIEELADYENGYYMDENGLIIFLILCMSDISDISALEGLTNLRRVDLFGNQISDISVLRNLTELGLADLRDNEISQLPNDILDWESNIEIKWEMKNDKQGGIFLAVGDMKSSTILLPADNILVRYRIGSSPVYREELYNAKKQSFRQSF